MSFFNRLGLLIFHPPGTNLTLNYFEDIWPVELRAINERRNRRERGPVQELTPDHPPSFTSEAPSAKAPWPEKTPDQTKVSPDPTQIFGGDGPISAHPDTADPNNPDPVKIRPRPVPCDTTGLALSGGGIRSAAVGLGALQGLAANQKLIGIDYLSTVSGGGYMGSCLSAGLHDDPGAPPHPTDFFPFGLDITDNSAVAHLRNYSNYLMPRGRSTVRNGSEAAVLLLRGLLANAVVIASALLFASLLTWFAYRDAPAQHGSFLLRLIAAVHHGLVARGQPWDPQSLPTWALHPFFVTGCLAAALAGLLLIWAIWRSLPLAEIRPSDTTGWLLEIARWLLPLTLVSAWLDLQPFAIEFGMRLHNRHLFHEMRDWAGLGGLSAFVAAMSGFASSLGQFLKKSERSTETTTLVLRVVIKAAILLAACILPLLLWIIYLALAGTALGCFALGDFGAWLATPAAAITGEKAPSLALLQGELWIVTTVISLCFGANAYSLHRFYRDRLSKAFLFHVDPAAPDSEPVSRDDVKLSELQGSDGPYHIINAAMNVQASTEANRRGRDADFFVFTPDFVGSDLTMYARTMTATTDSMEKVDPALNLGTAMAISGAAASANMGSNTIRALSPTLAALNIRLGYWLRNPRYLAKTGSVKLGFRNLLHTAFSKFYLVAEMLNLLDETSPILFLTDGGHIENLGVYELLKRGCKIIVVVDAEADPHMGFGSLLKLERYARIDLGVRIVLPWEQINADHASAEDHPEPSWRLRGIGGRHCAVGEIRYANGAKGLLLYFKSSVTGDEKDYILDYWRRNPSFPHETTGDQFFTEEQFEMYRALGFHMVDSFFKRWDRFAFLEGPENFRDADAAFAAVNGGLFTA